MGKRCLTKMILLGNRPEFISKALDLWGYENGVILDFFRPGNPTDNAMIEIFNGRFRYECLNVNWFLSLEDARAKIDVWKQDYNDNRPHSSLGDQMPRDFAQCQMANLTIEALEKGPIFTNWPEPIRGDFHHAKI